jgi:hypothetical protein
VLPRLTSKWESSRFEELMALEEVEDRGKNDYSIE